MASVGTSTKKPNRIPLVCKICLRTFDQLPAHLKRVCMKQATPEEIRMTSRQARKDLMNHLRNGHVVDYESIELLFDKANRNLAVRLVESMGCFVRGKPEDKPASSRCPEEAHAVQQKELPQAPPETEEDEEDEGEHGRSEELEQHVLYPYRTPVVKSYQQALRKRVARAGLYRKHNLDVPLLAGFKQYLIQDLGVVNCSQEIHNVSRFLFFMDPSKASLMFVKDIPKTRNFFYQLRMTGLSHQTIANYIKNINRFLCYILNATNLRQEDPSLANIIIIFQSILKDIQQKKSKDVSKEVIRKRYRQLQTPGPSASDCWKVLRAAKRDVERILKKTHTSEDITMPEQLLVLYYLQAILQLKHLQHPRVVKNMTVQEWMQRKNFVSQRGQKLVIIAVKKHTTSSQQLTCFALNEEEEHMFHLYFTKLRCTATDSICGTETEHFFISSVGEPIYSPSNDLRRLHEKYHLSFITSQAARRAFETATKRLTDAQNSIVADYLAHSDGTAEKHYRILTHDNICSAIEVIEGVAEEGAQSTPKCTVAAAGSGNPKMDDATAFQELTREFPVLLDGQLPRKKERLRLTGSHDRHCYDRWRSDQRKMRLQNIIDHYAFRLPTEGQVTRYFQKMSWTANTPKASEVLEKWKPNTGAQPNVRQIKKLVKRQTWRGLTITDDPVKGKKVVTSRRFQKAEVVCDYHGEVITKTTAEVLMAHMAEGKMRRLFFFDGPAQKMCIDACEEHCACHPDKETIGRWINSSKKKDNIRAVRESFIINGQPVMRILFIAKRDIAEGEELLFDYRVSRKSFQGEVQALEWLDN
ncbi:uncharacterized protein [Lepisosteus oculatus]|uniref:uncharacterized protein isoform X1 n=1 Tax=Lepisosteus oculatus TaxID=7918 RepID=UPI0035F52FB7